MNQQSNNQQKVCQQHQDKNIILLQIGKEKQKQIGVCEECITSNELKGKYLISVMDFQNFVTKPNQILTKFPTLKNKNLLQEYNKEYTSQENRDPVETLKTFFSDFKTEIISLIDDQANQIEQNFKQKLISKVELVQTYEQICQKGKLKAEMQNYLLDNVNHGKVLKDLIRDINNDEEKNEQILKDKLESFKNQQSIIKQQLSIQQKLKDITKNLVQLITKTFVFDNKSDNLQQQIQGFQSSINDISQSFQQFVKQFSNEQPQNINNQIVQNKNGSFQINGILPLNNYPLNIKGKETIEIFHSEVIQQNLKYYVQLNLEPFLECQEQYSFQIGIKQTQQPNLLNNLIETSYFLSNIAVKGKIHTKVEKGMDIQDFRLSHSKQMRQLEFIICLKNKTLQLQDFPKRENVTKAYDERLEKIDSNQKFNFFIKTQNIKHITIAQFKATPMS
ncbi:hypothetical protein ABPG74_007833 [Tetrahymena malaccensis]